ncbi:MAG: dockerin type I repeat-containing protein [Candidatus Roizmanbacteria bacterium]|nr:dockerin type I repeat-containing protein [Candidatus Roizmanbacteria bacterium]
MLRTKFIILMGGLFSLSVFLVYFRPLSAQAQTNGSYSPQGIVNCNGRTCPVGTRCYQPPMTVCPQGMGCTQVMPPMTCIVLTPTPKPCPLRIKGDANCDSVVNALDYDVFKSQLQTVGNGPLTGPNPLSSSDFNAADFNGDKKVNVLDFEIWRNTFLK